MILHNKLRTGQTANLLIHETKNTPKIIFNSKINEWLIIGRSYPNDASVCYQPILKWLDEIEERPIMLCSIHFRLEYFSTNTSKIFMDMLIKLKSIVEQKSMNLKIKWYYELGDDDMKETGESLFELAKLPYELIGTEEYFKGMY